MLTSLLGCSSTCGKGKKVTSSVEKLRKRKRTSLESVASFMICIQPLKVATWKRDR